MKYNCCQQSDLCPKNKMCKPFNSQEKSWKRFTCECPDGYHGDNCEQPITSCQGYAQGSRKLGKYKIVNTDDNSVYEVYCHFDSDGAWTLVQSYNLANGSLNSKFKQFGRTLVRNDPVSENDLTWSGYRLSKPRMKSIKDNSTFLQFTCEYEKNLAINKSDYIQFPNSIHIDVLELSGNTRYITIGERCGKIGGYDLRDCQIWLNQQTGSPLHVHIVRERSSTQCMFQNVKCAGFSNKYFGKYSVTSECRKQVHSCTQNDNSTTQIWFGTGRDKGTTQPVSANIGRLAFAGRDEGSSGDESGTAN